MTRFAILPNCIRYVELSHAADKANAFAGCSWSPAGMQLEHSTSGKRQRADTRRRKHIKVCPAKHHYIYTL